MLPFEIRSQTHLHISHPNKHSRTGNNDVFNISFQSSPLRLRFRPAWTHDGVGAVLNVVHEGKVWDCVRYIEHSETKHLGNDWFNDKYARTVFKTPDEEAMTPEAFRAHWLRLNEEKGGYKKVPPNVAWSSTLGCHSFWAHLTTRSDATVANTPSIKDIQSMGLRREADNHAVLELYAVLHVPVGYIDDEMPESETHYSMRLELLLIE